MQSRPRPVYLNLWRLHLPVAGWVSILHRLSGALLFFLLPVFVWAFSRSLTSESDFAHLASWLSTPFSSLLVLVPIWAFAHHFFAGLRHLAMDAEAGMQLKTARSTSLAVLLAASAVTLYAAWALYV